MEEDDSSELEPDDDPDELDASEPLDDVVVPSGGGCSPVVSLAPPDVVVASLPVPLLSGAYEVAVGSFEEPPGGLVAEAGPASALEVAASPVVAAPVGGPERDGSQPTSAKPRTHGQAVTTYRESLIAIRRVRAVTP
ncbi:MAG: hypothetical protein ACE37F_30160 [Nannocystaceae bacterium]|nr:hypothetical protein [bacterium]